MKYHLGDHLGSSNVVIDSSGNLINREEFTPYGETSFGSFARKRYRFTGKERDEESGLNYHGARYYAPWLIRWASCDPAGPVASLNLYSYSQNPLLFVDPNGTDPLKEGEIDTNNIQEIKVGNSNIKVETNFEVLKNGSSQPSTNKAASARPESKASSIATGSHGRRH